MNKLFGLDWKSRFETNNYKFFYFIKLNSVENMSKLVKKCPKITISI